MLSLCAVQSSIWYSWIGSFKFEKAVYVIHAVENENTVQSEVNSVSCGHDRLRDENRHEMQFCSNLRGEISLCEQLFSALQVFH